MAFEDLTDPAAIEAAAREFDRLGRTAFLAKYGFGPARDYFLVPDGKRYDSKAIVGAAHGHQFPDRGPLGPMDFSGGAATVQRKLAAMQFNVTAPEKLEPLAEAVSQARASDLLQAGEIYTRDQLRVILNTQDATINTGVFRPAGFASVLLFVTETKPSDRTQYVDELDGDILRWQGQSAGRTDALIIEHEARGLELLLFYRTKKYEHPHAAFKYEGAFEYDDHEGALPASFILRRVGKLLAEAELEIEVEAELEAEKEAKFEATQSGAFDPTSLEDARKQTFAAIVVRQGQPAFRKKLLEAYERRCALTDCDVEDVLEAAHICRYMGEETNVVPNGLLLRADLHTLFDRALIAIDPSTHEVLIAEELKGTQYASLDGRLLRLPAKPEWRPSHAALLMHLQLVRSVWEKRSGEALKRGQTA